MVNIISFVSTGTCPAGWIESTAFVDRIPAFGTVTDVSTTGGVSVSNHAHSVPTDNGGWMYHAGSGWTRNTTIGGETINLSPLHIKVMFCKRTWTGDYIVPIQSLLMFDGTCPTGFINVATYNDRQPVGATSSLGTTGQTAGSHSHSLSTFVTDNAATGGRLIGAGTYAADFLSSTTLFSYVKVVLCRKS